MQDSSFCWKLKTHSLMVESKVNCCSKSPEASYHLCLIWQESLQFVLHGKALMAN
uniref:Uncharacterized protein n=1 Tax=Oryza brachyantha TaxID=4533 RepID=J3L9C8_ORYBR